MGAKRAGQSPRAANRSAPTELQSTGHDRRGQRTGSPALRRLNGGEAHPDDGPSDQRMFKEFVYDVPSAPYAQGFVGRRPLVVRNFQAGLKVGVAHLEPGLPLVDQVAK